MAWEMQAGDPLDFAFRIAFTRNPHGDADRSEPAMHESWGSFAMWVDGENLCAHWENDELTEGSHWYLLPLLEWLVDSWDPLLHEQRLPLKNVGYSAAEAMAVTKLPSLQLANVDEFSWMDQWARWWHRHNVRSSREGGLFPDVYVRRYRDEVEISSGSDGLPGVPPEFAFLWRRRRYTVALETAAAHLYEVLKSASEELLRRQPDSPRIQRLVENVQGLALSESRRIDRMAWLTGYGEDMDAYRLVSDAVDEAFADTPYEVREALLGARRQTDLVVFGTPYARLLYGAYSPVIDLKDVATLASAFVKNYTPDAQASLRALDEVGLHEDDMIDLTPGEQGSRLGEAACEITGGTDAGDLHAVDIERVLATLGVGVSDVSLSDEELRAVSAVGPTQSPHIFINSNFAKRGRVESTGVRRFTLAHELCHLLLDREIGDELAVASGPWAPVAIEQRANAFAAAFLMPSWLLREALSSEGGKVDDIRTLDRMARHLEVSVSSLVDRLYNLGEVAFDDRNRLRAVVQRRIPEGRLATGDSALL